MHFRGAADCKFHHSVLRLCLHAEYLIQRFGTDRTFVRRGAFLHVTLTKRAPRFPVRTTNGFSRVINLLHGGSQFLDAAFTADVHEVNFRLIEEEMVVQRGYAESVVECG